MSRCSYTYLKVLNLTYSFNSLVSKNDFDFDEPKCKVYLMQLIQSRSWELTEMIPVIYSICGLYE